MLPQGKVAALCGCDPLYRFAIDHGKRGAQAFMALYDSVEGQAQCAPVKLTHQTYSQGNVIDRADTLHLRQEPQPLLCIGERKMLGTDSFCDRRQLSLPAA